MIIKKIFNFCYKACRKIIFIMRRPFEILITNHNLKKKLNFNDKIHVVFVCQCQHIWDKQRSFVLKLHSNERFLITLLILEDEGIIDNTVFEQFAKEHDIKFIKYYKKVTKELKPDILFYSRPYNDYLPKELRPPKMIKTCKTALIPYGYSLMTIGNINLNKWFADYLSLLFSDNDYSHNYFIQTHKRNIKREIQFSYNVGYPYFEDLYENLPQYINGKHFFTDIDKFKVIWTPRWTTDENAGGSNFFNYIDLLFDLFVDKEGYSFIFRPHPYALSNYVSCGLLSEEKKEYYLQRLSNSNNSYYDNGKEYLSNFFRADLLITDVSSIIPEFMFTGKPIIFCHNKTKDILNSIGMDFCEHVFYNAYSEEDLLRFVNDLKNGVDPLKEEREEYCKKFQQSFQGTNERLEKILFDFCHKWKK